MTRSSEYRATRVQLPEQERPFPERKLSSTPPPLSAPPPQTTDAALRRLGELERAHPRAAQLYRSFRPEFSVHVAVQKTEEALRRG